MKMKPMTILLNCYTKQIEEKWIKNCLSILKSIGNKLEIWNFTGK